MTIEIVLGFAVLLVAFLRLRFFMTKNPVRVVQISDANDGSVEDRVIRLLSQGKKINAIKLYREQTGVGLREAKDAVERIELQARIRMVQDSDSYDGSVTDQVIGLICQGKKINAIKLYREQTGVGLKEAKDAVERIELQAQIQ